MRVHFPITDDDINEADEVFIITLEEGDRTRRVSSFCIIKDNDGNTITIGYLEKKLYAFLILTVTRLQYFQ